MDEAELHRLFQAAQPILQRTAPAQGQGALPITPPVLRDIGWGVVLAYVANSGRPTPRAIPRGAQSGEAPLRNEELRTALDALSQTSVQPRLETGARSRERFAAAARRLLGAYGWPAPRAAQAADEIAAALASAAKT